MPQAELCPAPTDAPVAAEISSRPSRRGVAAGVLALLIVFIVYLSQVWYYRHYVNDDAYITFRYSRALADGLGPYFNAGERVEGYSNFSLMLLLTPIIDLFGPESAPVAAKTIGVLAGLGSLVIVYLLIQLLLSASAAGRTTARLWAFTGAFLVAVNPSFALNSVSGLETSLFAFLLITGVTLTLREVVAGGFSWSGAVLAVASLTRPEGLLIAPLIVVASGVGSQGLSRPRLRLVLINLALVFSTIAAHLVLRRFLYDGEWLPNTFHAKVSVASLGERLDYLLDGSFAAFGGPVGLAVLTVVLALVGKAAFRWAPLLALAVFGAALPLLVGPDWMPGWRLLMPYLPAAAALAALACASVVGVLPGRFARWAPLALGFLLLTLGLFHHDSRLALHQHIELRAEGYRTGHQALADWLRRQPRDSTPTVALMDIGIVGYANPDMTIVDVTGLTDRTIAMSPGTFLNKEYSPHYILGREPDYVILTLTAPGRSYTPPPPSADFVFWTPMERRLYFDPLFRASYRRLARALPADTSWTGELARELGAVRVFEHGYPENYMLLAVFHRTPGSPQPSLVGRLDPQELLP